MVARAPRRPKKTYKETFLAKLIDLSGDEQKFINNHTLRKALDWDEERYSRVKSALEAEKLINSGRGGPGRCDQSG